MEHYQPGSTDFFAESNTSSEQHRVSSPASLQLGQTSLIDISRAKERPAFLPHGFVDLTEKVDYERTLSRPVFGIEQAVYQRLSLTKQQACQRAAEKALFTLKDPADKNSRVYALGDFWQRYPHLKYVIVYAGRLFALEDHTDTITSGNALLWFAATAQHFEHIPKQPFIITQPDPSYKGFT